MSSIFIHALQNIQQNKILYIIYFTGNPTKGRRFEIGHKQIWFSTITRRIALSPKFARGHSVAERPPFGQFRPNHGPEKIKNSTFRRKQIQFIPHRTASADLAENLGLFRERNRRITRRNRPIEMVNMINEMRFVYGIAYFMVFFY